MENLDISTTMSASSNADNNNIYEEYKNDKPNQKKELACKKEWKIVCESYKLRGVIGKGAGGTVIKAVHKLSGKKYAIKCIKNSFETFYVAKRVLREIQILRHLTQMKGNVHTTKLHDILHSEDFSHIFLVMDYMESDLKQVLDDARKIKMEEEHMVIIVYKLLCALKFLHESNIIHRDIKPSNILVDSSCNLKICDFGLARSLPKEEKQNNIRTKDYEKIAEKQTKERELRLKKRRTMSNHVYTRLYRPPEIIMIEKRYQTKADIWGMGCIIAELVCCSKPYIDAGVDPKDTKLFQSANSCFPLSPRPEIKF